MSKKWYNYFVSVSGENAADPGAAPDSTTEATPNAAQTVADIARSLAPQPPPPDVPYTPGSAIPENFQDLYQTAGLTTPPHGYTVDKISSMLQSQHIRDLPAEVKRSSVLVALDAAGVKVMEIIEDAVKRDRALDAFERVRQRSVDQLEAQKAQENQHLQAELDKLIADYRARMQANTSAVAQEKSKLLAWLERKRKEEERIAEAVAPFVTENPITRGPAAPTQ
ncbi:MAG: hypothetical protein HY820_08615 [Acidobacteria bacterium]|nr:hypothetical protein [Acidobacteriota bacterium]